MWASYIEGESKAGGNPTGNEIRLTEKPAQKGQECRTLGEVVRAKAAKLTAKMRLPSTICATPSDSMRRVRVRSSLSRERLRDSAAGLKEPPPALGMALTGMIAKTKGIGVQLENFNAVLPNSDFSYPGT